ncbi:MAG: alpha/beta hydrolase [Pseudomonadota bacterium]
MNLRWVLSGWCLALAVALGACSSPIKPTPVSGPPPPYDYTIVDPLAATVVGTPEALRAKVPDEINKDELTLAVLPDREIPRVFWYADRLKFSLVYQPGPAPLIFLIAGTGAGHDATKNVFLERALFQGGYHVISLASPTFPDFIIAASSTGVPGRAKDDAADLYRVMQLAYEEVKDRIEVEKFHLTGYSLGAWDAAFVADLDARERTFDFDKVLLINPPVSLYNSAKILDNMLDDNIPGGPRNLSVFVGNVVREFARAYKESSDVSFSGEYILYRLYTELEPSDDQLEALIGLAFRFSSANLTFASDVMTNSGLIKPANLRLGQATSLTEYFEVSTRTSFLEYFEKLYLPYFKERDPSITRQALIDEASLESIQGFLAGAQNIGMVTNADDIILAPGEIEYLEQLFGPRGRIFPTGGHMGNLETRAFTAHVVDFFGR